MRFATSDSKASILLSNMNSDTIHDLIENGIKYFQMVVFALVWDKFEIVSLAD